MTPLVKLYKGMISVYKMRVDSYTKFLPKPKKAKKRKAK